MAIIQNVKLAMNHSGPLLIAGKDPDELIRTDPEAWRRAVAEAQPVMDYFIERAAASVDLSSVAGRAALIDRLRPTFRSLHHPVERAAYIQELARRVSLDERTVGEALSRGPVERRGAGRPRASGDGAAAFCESAAGATASAARSARCFTAPAAPA